MQTFSPLRFRTYARDLEQAILGMSMPPRGWPIRTRAPAQPMTDDNIETVNVTPLPVVEVVPEQPKAQVPVAAEPLKRNITGAGNLGASIQKLLAAIKSEVDDAHTELHAAAGEVRSGINNVKSVTKALRSEANDIKSSLGQFSNMGPE